MRLEQAQAFLGLGRVIWFPPTPHLPSPASPPFPLETVGTGESIFLSHVDSSALVPLPVWLALAVFHHAGLFLLEVKYWK